MSASLIREMDWIKLIKDVGATTAIAVFLIWFLTLGLKEDFRVMKDGIKEIPSLVNEQRSIKSILQQICANGADTNRDRSLCFQR